MSELEADIDRTRNEAERPRRDWLVLPLLAVLTMCLIGMATELTSKMTFPEPASDLNTCLVTNDRSTGVRAIPNSVCRDGVAESGLVEMKFNSYGYRSGSDCGPKQPGTYRIVLLGSSYAMGFGVPQEATYGARLPADLEERTGRKVELCNEGLVWEVPRVVSMRFDTVLAAKPDLILWTITTWDIENTSLVLPEDLQANVGDGIQSGNLNRQPKPDPPFDLNQTSFLIFLRHYLWKSQSRYVQDILRAHPGYLAKQPGAQLEGKLRQFGVYAREIEEKANTAGVPLVTALLPHRVHVALISIGEWPSSIDPYNLDSELRATIETRGESYIDVLPGFKTIANPENYFLPVDGHPTADGHALLSRLLAKELTSGAVPALKISDPHATSERPN